MVKLGTRVVLGIPTTRTARRSMQWIDAIANLEMPLGSSLGRVWIEDEQIAIARNQICKKAIELDADYLVFVSDDVIPPSNMLLLMLDKIGREYPAENGKLARSSMITGVYWTKSYPPEPYLWRGLLQGTFKDWKAGEFLPVDLAGCDALMIETSVLKNTPEPWFSTDWVWTPGQRVSSIATEDFYFFTKARKAGFRLFADTSIQCFHEDRNTGALFGLTADMRQAGGVPQTDDSEEVLVAELGAGIAAPTYGAKANVVRFDMREEVKPDVRCDIRAIDEHYFGKFDLVSACHVLEHFPRGEAMSVLRHWTRLLKVGGKLVIRVPDIAVAFAGITGPNPSLYDWAMIYGDQEVQGAAGLHANGFTERKLRALLSTHSCLGEIDVTHDTEAGCEHNLIGTARLMRPDEPEAIATWWNEIEAQETVSAAAPVVLVGPVPEAELPAQGEATKSKGDGQ